MIDKVKTILWNRLNTSVGRNILSLYALQIANYILPLFTIPYLVRVLGPEKYGAVAFGQSFIAYFVLIINYGFNWSATRKISVQRDDREAVSKTAINVWTAKALLCGISFLVLLGLVQAIPRFRDASTLLFVLYGTAAGNVLFPTWLFQGLERMVPISVINLVVRSLATIGVFVFIHQPSDYMIYAGLLSFQWLGAGLLAVIVAYRNLSLCFALPTWKGVWHVLVEGWVLFLSMGMVSLYTIGNTFILGILTNNTVVGYYSAAEKLVKAVSGLLGPISQAVYPRVSRLASTSKAQALIWGRGLLLVMGGLGLSLSVLLWIGAPSIILIFLGSQYESSVPVIRILALLPFLIAFSNVLGIQILFPFHHEKAVLKMVFVAGIINLFLAVLFAPRWHASGMALAVVMSELFVSAAYMAYSWVHKLNPLRSSSYREH